MYFRTVQFTKRTVPFIKRTVPCNWCSSTSQGLYHSGTKFLMQNPSSSFIFSYVLKPDKLEGAYQMRNLGIFLFLDEHHLNPEVLMIIK